MKGRIGVLMSSYYKMSSGKRMLKADSFKYTKTTFKIISIGRKKGVGIV